MSGGRRSVLAGPSCLVFTSEVGQHFMSELMVVLTHCFVHFCFTSGLPGKALHVTWGLMVDGCLFNGTANIYKWMDRLATEQSRSGCVLLPQNFPSKCENEAGAFRRHQGQQSAGGGAMCPGV